MKDVNCPYCGHDQEINHDDGYGYDESRIHNQQCGKCGKTFTYTTSISFFYEAYQADCLNGGEHDYKLQHIIPKRHSKMECTTCGDVRELTQTEREQIVDDGL